MRKLINLSAKSPLDEKNSAINRGTEGVFTGLAVPDTADQAEFTKKRPVSFDCKIWLSAPRERTLSYFPVYSSVSKAIQLALRRWAGEWLCEHPDAIERKVSAYSLLAFSCTRPYCGRPTNVFTYDVQQGTALERALRTARRLLSERLAYIDGVRRADGQAGTISLMPARVAEYVRKNRHPIYKMFNVETMLMNDILKFTQISIPKIGVEKAAAELRSAFEKHLHRFTEEFDMAERTDELLRIATEALLSRQAAEGEMPEAA